MTNKPITWKYILLISATIIGLTIVFVTNSLVKDFEIEERKKVEIWAKGIQELNASLEKEIDFSFISEVIESNNTIPVILTDSSFQIISFRNIDTTKRGIKEVEKRLNNAINNSTPITLKLSDKDVNYIYYQTSILLTKLAFYPIIQFAIILILAIVFYIFYKSIRNSEQNRVWVGMARETAHQLGTPVSSLLAWVELIKLENIPASTIKILEKDVMRLERITDRFSKIGSEPILKEENIVNLVNSTVQYLLNRVSKNKITISVNTNKDIILVSLNSLLFEWVIENICKNAIDAIHGIGKVEIKISSKPDNKVYIDISDTGKGINSKNFKNIFQPGYTTKARGWGLGLSLTKRIVENYHNGKVFVLNSEMGRGTTFRIILPK